MSTQNRKYGKKLTITFTDGTTKEFTNAGAVNEIVRKMENNARYVHFNTEGVEEFYDIGSASCGFCLVAKVEPTAEDAENTPCEDALPNCEGDES